MRKQVKAAVEYYIGEITRRFPLARVEVIPETMDGSDVWLRVSAPGPQTLKVVDATAELNEECYDKFSVSILATVIGDTFTAPASGKLTHS